MFAFVLLSWTEGQKFPSKQPYPKLHLEERVHQTGGPKKNRKEGLMASTVFLKHHLLELSGQNWYRIFYTMYNLVE